MAGHPVETYLKDLSEIHRTGGGVAEESYYSSMESLFIELEREQESRVHCATQMFSCQWASSDTLDSPCDLVLPEGFVIVSMAIDG